MRLKALGLGARWIGESREDYRHSSSGGTFYGELRPISDKFETEALAVSGLSREQTLAFPEPEGGMWRFAAWLGRDGGYLTETSTSYWPCNGTGEILFF